MSRFHYDRGIKLELKSVKYTSETLGQAKNPIFTCNPSTLIHVCLKIEIKNSKKILHIVKLKVIIFFLSKIIENFIR